MLNISSKQSYLSDKFVQISVKLFCRKKGVTALELMPP